jgi:hypothetical protein
MFLAALLCSAAMLGTARALRPGIDGAGVMLEMLRFVLFIGAAVAAVAAWATAVFAALHHVIWPLVVAVLILGGSALLLALS